MARPLLPPLGPLLAPSTPPSAWVEAAQRWLGVDRVSLLLAADLDGREGEWYQTGGPTEPGLPTLEAPLGTTEAPLGRVIVQRHGDPFSRDDEADLATLAWVLSGALQARTAHEHAEAAQRSKLAFLANISHELRTPLNGILGFSHLLESAPLGPDHRMMVDTIRLSGQRLLETVENLLELAQFEAGQFRLETTPFSPRTVFEAVAANHGGAAAEKQLAWSLEPQATLSPVLIGDPVRLGRAWGHLLSNAVKFTKQGGVTLRLEGRPLGPGLEELSLTVVDTGVGYKPAAGPSGFVAFQQADGSLTRKFGGTGLGLTLADRLARAMGGGLEIEGQPGVGTTVRLWAVVGRAAEGSNV